MRSEFPPNYPLRRIRKLADQALAELYGTFELLYASEGRPSVPPEQLLLASLPQAFYALRSERLLLEQLHYNLLFRWFVGLSPDDLIWHPTTFTKNRERLLNKEVMGAFTPPGDSAQRPIDVSMNRSQPQQPAEPTGTQWQPPHQHEPQSEPQPQDQAKGADENG